ncbi:serine hydrolase domain-containing protein [Halalkalibaculum roseum]|nr:serine hydrolase domain-containing protein [Halalkalibaculum roseum]
MLSSCSGTSVELEASLDDFTRYLDERIPALMEWYTVPGLSIALVEDGEPVWTAAYGYADLERGKKLNINAIYRAESISKPVTAWGVLALAEKNLIDLDDPILKYMKGWKFPDSDFAAEEVTIRRLLSNSAGLPPGSLGEEYPPNAEKPTLEEYLAREVQIQRNPGKTFVYSNPGFNLLELLIEEVSGRDFSEYMQNEVLRPLGMESSSFSWEEEWSSRVPVGYDLKERPVGPYVYPYRASGGLFATVEDIARFAIAGAVNLKETKSKLLDRESIREMHTPQVPMSGIFGFVADSYGYGHFIETLPEGEKAVWHGGQGHGWMTHFHLIPETGDAIVVFTNSQRSWPMMAEILNEWSQWEGYGPVKFSRIITLVTALWVLTGMFFLLALYRGIRTFYEWRGGRRKVLLKLQPLTTRRALEFLLWVAITTILVWSVNQEYLFLSSVFPLGSSLLGWVLLFLSVVLLFSIITPLNKANKSIG